MAVSGIIWDGIIFFTFLFICGSLAELRFSRAAQLWAAGGTLAGILLLQWVLLQSGQDVTLVLTLLPVTAYFPAIICLHILSSSRFFPTAAVWTLGLTACFTTDILRKLLLLLCTRFSISGAALDAIITVCMLLTAAAIAVLVFRVLHAPFRSCVLHTQPQWLPLCFPALMVLLLFSYFSSSTTNPTLLVLLLLTVLSVFWVLTRALTSAAEAARLRDTERAARLQLELQRQQCDELAQRIRLGRIYRHDMRHHLRILDSLAQQDNAADILAYIGQLNGRLSDISERSYCANPSVNAVLASFLRQAEKAGCAVTSSICLPRQFPFDELDICVLLANPLENALRACQDLPAEKRYLRVQIELTDGQKLTLAVDNPCFERPAFDQHGLPVSDSEGHGLGLRSAQAVAEKYHGLVRCQWHDGEFQFRAALFDWNPATSESPAEQPRRSFSLRRAAVSVAAAALMLLFILNAMPQLSDALLQVPVLGSAVRLADARSFGWGDTAFTDSTADTDDTEALDAQQADFIAQMEDAFWWYAARKYHGYVGMDISHQVLRDDEQYLVVRFDGVLNAGGSGQYSRCFTLDRSSGRILALADLFEEGADYVSRISQEILEQMTQQVEAGLADYFIPGGIWSDEECFQRIDPDQNFRLNEDGDLVILFDEYEVAPGSMGLPEFTIPRQSLEDILLPDVL